MQKYLRVHDEAWLVHVEFEKGEHQALFRIILACLLNHAEAATCAGNLWSKGLSSRGWRESERRLLENRSLRSGQDFMVLPGIPLCCVLAWKTKAHGKRGTAWGLLCI
eukprot:1161924-Pelagomonas_calceolata.AAC.4